MIFGSEPRQKFKQAQISQVQGFCRRLQYFSGPFEEVDIRLIGSILLRRGTDDRDLSSEIGLVHGKKEDST
ncbi:hypothetical protein RclHR1_00160018 [Rhizophagus clarus]|uniref:Uncharacterized protein n=1 Tax=Rhizophagus clarus TaxID=94130 RepID=A0A2Z6QKN5_9GLOM|nr:hypothetical protein RclHR1_00160018 [Rhizophagus clarus]GES81097.1 hypothetical protein RCL_jg17939.t1 [Rhizophagus clarus]